MIEEIIRSYRNLSDKVEDFAYSVSDKLYGVLVPDLDGLELCYFQALPNGKGEHNGGTGKQIKRTKRKKGESKAKTRLKKHGKWDQRCKGPKHRNKKK